jgi:hypothetical protein
MSTIIAGVFLLAFIVAGFYGLLRYLFPRTGEAPVIALVLSFFALALGTQSGIAALIVVIVAALFKTKVVEFLTSCNITRDNFETIAKGIISRK